MAPSDKKISFLVYVNGDHHGWVQNTGPPPQRHTKFDAQKDVAGLLQQHASDSMSQGNKTPSLKWQLKRYTSHGPCNLFVFFFPTP